MNSPVVAFLNAVALLGLIASAPPARSAEGDEPPIDRQLLEQLLGDPIDAEAERDLRGSSGAPSGGGNQPQDRGAGGQQPAPAPAAGGQPAGEASAPAANPLADVARHMRDAQGRLARADSGPQTQTIQDQIVARLDELIRRTQSQCRQRAASPRAASGVAARKPVPQQRPGQRPSQGARQPDTKPVTNPNAAPGHADPQRPTPEEIRGMLEALWGELPPADRQQMLELPVGELFLPGYQWWIEQYFRSLAEEGD